MANPIPTDQATVLQAVVDRLIARLTAFSLTTSTCFISAEPEILEPNSSANLFITVCAMDGQFAQDELTGAGEALCIENAGVIITPHTAVKLDRVEHVTNSLMVAGRGLLVLKKAILKAMKTSDRLQDSSNNELLVNLMHPLHGMRPRYNPDTGLALLSVTFSTDFQWDLS